MKQYTVYLYCAPDCISGWLPYVQKLDSSPRATIAAEIEGETGQKAKNAAVKLVNSNPKALKITKINFDDHVWGLDNFPGVKKHLTDFGVDVDAFRRGKTPKDDKVYFKVKRPDINAGAAILMRCPVRDTIVLSDFCRNQCDGFIELEDDNFFTAEWMRCRFMPNGFRQLLPGEELDLTQDDLDNQRYLMRREYIIAMCYLGHKDSNSWSTYVIHDLSIEHRATLTVRAQGLSSQKAIGTVLELANNDIGKLNIQKINFSDPTWGLDNFPALKKRLQYAGFDLKQFIKDGDR